MNQIPPNQAAKFMPGANIQQMMKSVDINTLVDEKCPECGSNIKLNATRTLIMPATHPENKTGHPVPIGQPYYLCIKCILLKTLDEWWEKAQNK